MNAMNQRPNAETEVLPQARKYVELVQDGDILAILEAQHASTVALLNGLTADQADHRYAEGKWSIKEVIGHVTDNERVWAYRLLRIARNDARGLVGYDENVIAAHAPFAALALADIVAEYDAVRHATLYLLRQGDFNGHPLTARAAAYVIAGHEAHHINIINERYLQS
jgi:hypothetical protein